MLPTIAWKNNKVIIIDQRKLPKEVYITCTNYKQVANAIKNMAIRGAPAIGIAAAYAISLAAKSVKTNSIDEFKEKIENVINEIEKTRPTARNLFFAVEKIKNIIQKENNLKKLKERIIEEAKRIEKDEIIKNENIAKNGIKILPKNSIVLTYCNTGSLATSGIGTALGIIKLGYKKKKISHVYACETRPFLQGLRLTAWELKKEKIKFTLITDNMAAYLMKENKINLILVGADRIAKNGDTANKIGTYNLAVLAKYHNIPFYVAAPSSSIDTSILSGKEIIIEERRKDEIFDFLLPQYKINGINIINPAFDVTPANLITGIITEKKVYFPPYNF
jgi:methylthioribose-1-phosphate isomerase